MIAPGLVVPLGNNMGQNNFILAFGWVILGVILILHIYSSVKLGRSHSGCLIAALLLGGWALMLVCFFVGCVIVMNNVGHH